MDKDIDDDEPLNGPSKQAANKNQTSQRAPTRTEHLRSELHSIISRLSAIYTGLPHRREAIFDFLAEVLRAERTLRSLGERAGVLSILESMHPTTLDGRITRKPFRQLIELTCKCSVKLRSRYANALAYAKANGCAVTELRVFIKRAGGIEACAREHVKRRRENER